jgi:predicted nucleic acid-binding protein
MAVTSTSSPQGAVVVDANIAVSIAANEPTEANTRAEIARYSALGYDFFAPGVIVAESIYVLCGKLTDGSLSASDHAMSIKSLRVFLTRVLPPPGGDVALLSRAESIRGSRSCRHSADGLYIALTEALSQTRPTVLLTYDESMSKQAAKAAPAALIHLLAA